MREEDIDELKGYADKFEAMLGRFQRSGITGPPHMAQQDIPHFKQYVQEVETLLYDMKLDNYGQQVRAHLFDALSNIYGSPSFSGVENIVTTSKAAVTAARRQHGRPPVQAATVSDYNAKNIFIIHGQEEARWRELRSIVKDDFGLNPIILSEQPNHGSSTLIEKFERYAPQCGAAIAIFTPDDRVTFNEETYVQARPNVIYELGWFCGRLGRGRVITLSKQGTNVFSDFSGVVQLRFQNRAAECISEIRREFTAAKII